MHHIMRWFMLVSAVFLVALQGVGGTVLGTLGPNCFPSSSPAVTVSVYGDWIENINRVTAPPGVSVTILGKFNGAQNNTQPYQGKGRVDLSISTNNAATGANTIKLINDPKPIIGGGETFSFTITVQPHPSVTSVDVPPESDPFQNITVTLHGAGLEGAADPAAGAIVLDNLVPFVTVGGNATVSSVRVLSSSSTSLQAKIFFSALIQDVTVEITLKSTTYCSPLGVGISGPAGFKTRVRVKSSNIRNYVQSIVPVSSCFDKNSIATININLLFAAPSGGTTRLKGGALLNFPVGSTTANENATVSFKLVPANAFEAVPNGTPINASGFTVVKANPGEDIIPITFKIKDCLGGQPGQTNLVKIQTWMHTTNTNLPPDFVEQTFCVRCIQ